MITAGQIDEMALDLTLVQFRLVPELRGEVETSAYANGF